MSVFRDLKKLTRDIVQPYIVGMQLWVKESIEVVQVVLTALDNRITTEMVILNNLIITLSNNLNVAITNLVNTYTTKYTTSTTTLNSHVTNVNDPHVTTMVQIATRSVLPPTAAQGTVGDVWIEYINS